MINWEFHLIGIKLQPCEESLREVYFLTDKSGIIVKQLKVLKETRIRDCT